MRLLGIETSCDETAAAVVTDKRDIRSNCVLSQMEHAQFGGVVPEIAARAHLDYLDQVIRNAMEESGTEFSDLDGVAVTAGPGLIGGVIVGVMTAKAIASVIKNPIIAVNHLEGHALSARLADSDLDYPFLLLLVTGGHCQLLGVHGVGQYTRYGTTLDDAVGECFDKSAKLMGLGYPGGPAVEKMAADCPEDRELMKNTRLPLSMVHRPGCDFSFSGIKTAVRRHIEAQTSPDPVYFSALCKKLQTTIAEILVRRTKNAIDLFRKDHPGVTNPALVVAGGVAANQHIRTRLQDLTEQVQMRFSAPPLSLCSDNAAMIAWAGIERLQSGLEDDLTFRARPRWPLDPDAPMAIGAGVKA